jgi:hypothetical protein
MSKAILFQIKPDTVYRVLLKLIITLNILVIKLFSIVFNCCIVFKRW